MRFIRSNETKRGEIAAQGTEPVIMIRSLFFGVGGFSGGVLLRRVAEGDLTIFVSRHLKV